MMNTPTHTGAWEFRGEATLRLCQQATVRFPFDELTPCIVRDYHDGLQAEVMHGYTKLCLPVSDMRGEWREPMEGETFHDLDPKRHARESVEWTAKNPVATGIEAEVCQSIAERQKEGVAKYGTSLADADLTPAQTLRHAREGAQDLACYLMRAEKEVEALRVVTQEMLAVCLRISAFLETDVEMDNATHEALNVAINHAQKV